jgi:hypothetical protein
MTKIVLELKGVMPGQETCGACQHRVIEQGFSRMAIHQKNSCAIFKKSIDATGKRRRRTRLPECLTAEVRETH